MSDLPRIVAIVVAGCALAPHATAREAEPARFVTVTGKATIYQDGKLIAPKDAYVYVVDDSDPEGVERARVEIEQKNYQFSPRLVVVPAGTKIAFPNRDKALHNVFANDPNYFDLGRDTVVDKSYRFDLEGEIDVFCDIHAEMSAKVKVMPSSRFVAVAADGSYALQVPTGTRTLALWVPDVKESRKSITVAAGDAATLDLKISFRTEKKEAHRRKNGQPYKKKKGRYP